MLTYEDIAKANEAMRTTTIEKQSKNRDGSVTVNKKDYAEVNQRILAFRKICPDGAITTEIISNEDGVCVMRAIVTSGDGAILATGTAYEKEGSTFINKTSYIENCETSAVGRALGMLGLGIDTSVASYEEVANAMAQQAQSAGDAVEDAKLRSEVLRMVTDRNINADKLAAQYGVESLLKLKPDNCRDIIRRLKKEGK